MNWRGCGRKRSWPNLRHYLGIYLEGLKEITKNLIHDSRFWAEIWTRDLQNTTQEWLPLRPVMHMMSSSENINFIIQLHLLLFEPSSWSLESFGNVSLASFSISCVEFLGSATIGVAIQYGNRTSKRSARTATQCSSIIKHQLNCFLEWGSVNIRLFVSNIREMPAQFRSENLKVMPSSLWGDATAIR
jgi:hypothetical protein